MAEIATALAYTSAFVTHAVASFCFMMAMSILLFPAYYKVHPAPCSSKPTTSTALIHAVDKANEDGEKDMDEVAYVEWMPKQTTLHEHSTMDWTCLPVAVAQLVSELDKHHWFGQDDQEIPQAIHISSGGPCDELHDACQAQQVCAVDGICQLVEPWSAPTADQTPGNSSPCVIIQPSAQADTTPRREKSLYGANIQVGLAISTVDCADVFAIRVELACPDNGDGQLVATAMWCLTATIAEVENLRDAMQPDVDDSEMLLLYKFDTPDDLQTFFDAVTARPNWSDAPALRRFCQMW
ncbi:hypothetical protein AeMF1_013150 [Aphanomyces euteiches]|nr:hypothetical protein AeMF1_013150 [Aphanomyces euteiches]KAH9187079.1 hypothetical protein AeNC1_010941 [Aphanomyces euteiches]